MAGNPLASDKVWTFTTAGIATYVSDMTWTSESNGLGPAERDKSNGQGLAGDGGTLTLNGVPYTKGLGVHASSDIRVALGSACSALTAVVGVDDEVGLNGSVVFQVWTDGVKRYDSGTMTGATASANVSVPVAGVSLLALVVTDAADGISNDHADWANPQVSCSIELTPPTVVTVTPANGATGQALTANTTATFSEAMNPATLTTTTVTLVPQGSTTPVPASVSYNAGTNTVTLDPGANLVANTMYTATIKGGSSGAKDAAGNALAADKVWTFSTSAPPTATIAQPLATFKFKVGDVITYSGSATDSDQRPDTLCQSSLGRRAPPLSRRQLPLPSVHQQQRIERHVHRPGPRRRELLPDRPDGDEQCRTHRNGLGGHPAADHAAHTGDVGTRSAGRLRWHVRDLAGDVHDDLSDSTHTIHAPSPQGVLSFINWSDGGAQQHNVVAGATDVTFTATFADITAPTVSTVGPASGATGVAQAANTTAVFSEPMNASTLNTTTVTLVPQGSSTPVAAVVTYDSATKTVTLNPTRRHGAHDRLHGDHQGRRCRREGPGRQCPRRRQGVVVHHGRLDAARRSRP